MITRDLKDRKGYGFTDIAEVKNVGPVLPPISSTYLASFQHDLWFTTTTLASPTTGTEDLPGA
jgi:hypothetical protein